MSAAPSSTGFRGFTPLNANFVFCPNQFFDVCLRYGSRGEIRLVSHLLRKTIGFLDDQGEPVDATPQLSYSDLVRNAAISRSMIGESLKDACSHHYISCVKPGSVGKKGNAGCAPRYAIKWDILNSYTVNRDSFLGFFGGEGHRTQIPNSFFDFVVPNEPRSVVQVVGMVLRHTVGYANQFGVGRRSSVPLSISYLQELTGISDRKTIVAAINTAIKKKYIVRVSDGVASGSLADRRTAVYAPFWLKKSQNQKGSLKTLPMKNLYQGQSENPTDTSLKTLPSKQSENPTKGKTPNQEKQQTENPVAVKALLDFGFDSQAASSIAGNYSEQQIFDQIAWHPLRGDSTNPQGRLRRAIEGNWDKPKGSEQDSVKQKEQILRERESQKKQQQELEDQARASKTEKINSFFFQLSKSKREHYVRQAIDREPNEAIKAVIEKRGIDDQPFPHVRTIILEDHPELAL